MNAAGFWSYSHDDDERDGHGLLRLAAHIQNEFALVTGETLTLFVDRDDIAWGEEWRRRIETALAETTFFIPVITPLYFKRDECRRELLSFVGQAQSLGVMELVMPLLYVEVPDLVEDSSDETRALVARMQYVDWRELRLSPENSAEYRRGVNSLALRLAEINNRYEQSESPLIADALDGEEEEEGLMDLLAIIEQKFPGWQENIDDGNAIGSQISAIGESYEDRLKKAERRGTTGPVLNVLRSYARELEPLYRRLIEYGKNYSAASIDLDPLVLRVLRELEVYPEFSRSALAALSPIEDTARIIISDEDDEDTKKDRAIKEFLRRYKGISKDIARLYRLDDSYTRYQKDANSLVLNWHQSIRGFKQRNQGLGANGT
jgi:hypothetical protein